MSNSRLSEMLAALEQAEKEMNSLRLVIWDELASFEPQLAEEVLGFFSTREAAALWVTSSRTVSQSSPARQVVEGKVEEVVARLRRSVHGFSA